MKTLLTRILPLLLFIALGTAISWASFYSRVLAVHAFHNVPAMRACEAAGTFLLTPARWIFEGLGANQADLFVSPNAFWGANGLIFGVIFYSVYRAVVGHRVDASRPRPASPQQQQRLEVKAH